MKVFVMKRIGKVGVVEKDRPTCGPLDVIVRPTKGLICTSDVHTVPGAIGERKYFTLGHEVVGVTRITQREETSEHARERLRGGAPGQL